MKWAGARLFHSNLSQQLDLCSINGFHQIHGGSFDSGVGSAGQDELLLLTMITNVTTIVWLDDALRLWRTRPKVE